MSKLMTFKGRESCAAKVEQINREKWEGVVYVVIREKDGMVLGAGNSHEKAVRASVRFLNSEQSVVFVGTEEEA